MSQKLGGLGNENAAAVGGGKGNRSVQKRGVDLQPSCTDTASTRGVTLKMGTDVEW